jgi:hypothetical protein
MSSYKGVPELLMDMRTMVGPLSVRFSIGVPSEVTTTRLLVRYCLLVATIVGVVSSASVHLVARLEDCLVPEAASLDLLRVRSTAASIAFGVGGDTTSGVASASVVHLGSRFCLGPYTAIFDLLRSEWPLIGSTTSAVVGGAGGSALSDCCFPTTSASSET